MSTYKNALIRSIIALSLVTGCNFSAKGMLGSPEAGSGTQSGGAVASQTSIPFDNARICEGREYSGFLILGADGDCGWPEENIIQLTSDSTGNITISFSTLTDGQFPFVKNFNLRAGGETVPFSCKAAAIGENICSPQESWRVRPYSSMHGEIKLDFGNLTLQNPKCNKTVEYRKRINCQAPLETDEFYTPPFILRYLGLKIKVACRA